MSTTIDARSLAFIGGARPQLSLVTESGEHYFINLRDAQVALLSEQTAADAANKLRRRIATDDDPPHA